MRLEIIALRTLPEVQPGDDLAALIHNAAAESDQTVVLAVAQKIVS